MKLMIGFANKYFTIWEVSDPYDRYIDKYNYYTHVDYTYLQNLSMDKDKAIDKAKNFGKKFGYDVDLEPDHNLRGHSNRNFSIQMSDMKNNLEEWQFPNGFYNIGDDIRECDDVKTLFSLYLKKNIVFHKENPKRPEWRRPIVYAKQRLAELGALVKYDNQYMTPEYVNRYKAKKERELAKDGHFYENRKRMELDVKKVGEFNVETRFGRMYLMTFVDLIGRKFIYRGGNPIDFPDDGGFHTIKGTIKHNEYNGTPQTLIQRVKT